MLRRFIFRGGDVKPCIIVGSSPSAIILSNRLLPESYKVAINNAWRIRSDFDASVFPSDFPKERQPDETFKGKTYTDIDYMPPINKAGGIIYCGATMAFAAGYWALSHFSTPLFGYYGCDMVYNAVDGKNHFYGNGTADPLREDISLRSLEARSTRLFAYALNNRKFIVNCSESHSSRLQFPRIGLDKLPEVIRQIPRLVKDPAWKDFVGLAKKNFVSEQRLGHRALKHDYCKLAKDATAEVIIIEMDEAWQIANQSLKNALRALNL
jgi:hypothetical protein